MVVYSFHIFDRHSKVPRSLCYKLTNTSSAECIYSKSWLPPSTNPADPDAPAANTAAPTTSSDDAKLLFGTVFSLRNMVRKLGGDDDAFISYRTAQYKLHFYETPANLRFVILTDTATLSMRNVLHQIYINLWVEYGMFKRFLSVWWCANGGSQWSRILWRRLSTSMATASRMSSLSLVWISSLEG